MSTEHQCPRRSESWVGELHKGPDHWTDGRCTYCGSLHPDTFMQHVEAGGEIAPTDKNYKAYLYIPNPRAGKSKILSSANFKREGDRDQLVTDELRASLIESGIRESDVPENGHYVQVGPDSPQEYVKFYYQHLAEEQKKQFVELLNQRKIKIGHPGRFYVLPYFIEANV